MTTNEESKPDQESMDDHTMLSTGICCKECSVEMDQVDTTYSNINTSRCEAGQHTGDVYQCSNCDALCLDNMLTGEVESFSY